MFFFIIYNHFFYNHYSRLLLFTISSVIEPYGFQTKRTVFIFHRFCKKEGHTQKEKEKARFWFQ